MLRLRIGRLEIQYDTDYGCNHRSGWSIVWEGKVYAELRPWLLGACIEAIRIHKLYES